MVSTQHSALSTQHSALSTQPASVLARRNWFFNIIGVLVGLLLTLNSVAKECSPASYGVISNSDHLNICAGIESTTNGGHSDVATACHKNIDAYYSIFDNICPHTYCNNLYDKHILRKDGGLVVQTWGGAFWRYAQWYVVTYHSRYTPGVWTAEHRFPASVTIFGQDEQCSDTPPPASTLLTLTPAPNQKDPRPLKAEGKDGQSTYELIAKVMEGSTPKAGVAVTFAVEVEPNTGGHDHHDASRPKGLVNGTLTASGKTEANGEIKVTFQASQIAGTHVVAAVCESCTNKSVTKNVDVKVPDLVDLLTLPFRTSQWNPVGIGDTPKHRDNHYLTSAAIYRLLEISSKYQKIWPTAPKLTLNDASIKWGGKFDIGGTWDRSKDRHAEHRIGDNIDIRANGNIGSVPANIRLAVKRWLQNKSTDEDNISEELSIESVNPLHEGIGEENEHFHLRLGN